MAHLPTLILDTHAAVHELVSAGMPERQAETVVRQQARLLEQNLATKTDIETLRQGTKTGREAIKASIEAFRHGIKADIKAFKVDLIKWIFALNIGTASLIIATLKLL